MKNDFEVKLNRFESSCSPQKEIVDTGSFKGSLEDWEWVRLHSPYRRHEHSKCIVPDEYIGRTYPPLGQRGLCKLGVGIRQAVIIVSDGDRGSTHTSLESSWHCPIVPFAKNVLAREVSSFHYHPSLPFVVTESDAFDYFDLVF